ncbi:MAG: DoxX family protein [Gammaproteobacteria bacterium]|nr:DoxX family protein [Gammaproteobacteria bacterium]
MKVHHPVIDQLAGLTRHAARILDWLSPLGLLIMRLWVGWAFLKSGYLKTTSWDSTLYLFNYEYQVPLLPPELAAWLATFIELVLPVLLIIGLAGRLSALMLFAFNIMAVISYPDLDPAAAYDHQAWGIMLLVLMLGGLGKLAVDHWLLGRFFPAMYR